MGRTMGFASDTAVGACRVTVVMQLLSRVGGERVG